jgi:hypothetical protein
MNQPIPITVPVTQEQLETFDRLLSAAMADTTLPHHSRITDLRYLWLDLQVRFRTATRPVAPADVSAVSVEALLESGAL